MPQVVRDQLWLDMIRRGLAARFFSHHFGEHLSADKAFSRGLCLEAGMVPLLARKRCYSDWYRRLRGEYWENREALERTLLGATHCEAFEEVGRAIGVPATFVDRIAGYRVAANAGDGESLDGVLWWASSYADLMSRPSAGLTLDDWIEDVTLPMFCSMGEVWETLERVERQIDGAAAALGVRVAPHATLNQIQGRGGSDEWNAAILSPPELAHWCRILEAQVHVLEASTGALTHELEQLQGKDALTGLLAHRPFLDQLEREVAAARHEGRDTWLLLVDLDGFTALNMRFGYFVGDRVIAAITGVLQRIMSDARVLGRVGPDAIGVLLDADDWRIRLVAERVRAAIEQERVDVEAVRLRVTAMVTAVGLSQLPPTASHEMMLSACWEALNKAGSGGNQVVLDT